MADLMARQHLHRLTKRAQSLPAGIIRREDLVAMVTKVFTKYIDLMRKLQTTYW